MHSPQNSCSFPFFFSIPPRPPTPTLFPYTTLFRSPSARWGTARRRTVTYRSPSPAGSRSRRSEEHTSELQSLTNLVCRLLLEKKNATLQHVATNFVWRTLTSQRTA